MNGIYVHLQHTGACPQKLHIQDISTQPIERPAFRSSGPVYVPLNGSINLAYTGDVVTSFESGTIRGYVNQGFLLAEIRSGGGFINPPGSLLMWAGDVADCPPGYLPCDGAAVNRVDYSALFAAIGTIYGSGDGTTTFNLPDLQGRSPLGAGSGYGLSPHSLADQGGAEAVTLSALQMPSHTHTGTVNSAGSHTHSSNALGGQDQYGLAIADGTNTVVATDSSQGELNVGTVPGALTINSDGSHQHTFTSDSAGSGQSHPNFHPFLAVNFIIKT